MSKHSPTRMESYLQLNINLHATQNKKAYPHHIILYNSLKTYAKTIKPFKLNNKPRCMQSIPGLNVGL